MLSLAAGKIIFVLLPYKDIELFIFSVVFRIYLADTDLSCTILESVIDGDEMSLFILHPVSRSVVHTNKQANRMSNILCRNLVKPALCSTLRALVLNVCFQHQSFKNGMSL